jgi:uncharacterized protein
MGSQPVETDIGFEFCADDFCRRVAAELKVSSSQIEGAVDCWMRVTRFPLSLAIEKRHTQGLDERQLRAIEDMLVRARELAARKNTILKTIAEQGQLTDALRVQIEQCWTDSRILEDLYLPYRPKKRTRASIARERGLQPLADILLGQQRLTRESRKEMIKAFVNPAKDVADEDAAIRGACDIVAEIWAETPGNRQWMIEQVQRGELVSERQKGKRLNKAVSLKTTLIAASVFPGCPPIDFWRCSVEKRKACCV